jgi:hydroxyacylglutathione hydrolase
MSVEIIVERVKNFPIESNCFVIFEKGGKVCIIVDPATGEGLLLDEYLQSKGLKPEFIILTHEHFDHISSVEYLREKHNCKVIASVKCSEKISDSKKNLSLFYNSEGFVCSPADMTIDTLEFEWVWRGIVFNFISTPGHTEGGLCFSVGSSLFTGDTILDQRKVVTKLPGGNKMQLEKSISMILDKYDGDTEIFPGHGEAFKLSAWGINTKI